MDLSHLCQCQPTFAHFRKNRYIVHITCSEQNIHNVLIYIDNVLGKQRVLQALIPYICCEIH